MKKQFLTLFLACSSLAGAQSPTPNELQKTATEVTKKLSTVGKSQGCETKEPDSSMVMATCDCATDLSKMDAAPLTIKEFKSIDAMPSGLKKLALASHLKPGGPIKVLIRETNDAIFTPVGALAFVVDPASQNPFQPAYDMGNTHNTEIEVSQTNKNGITYTLHGNSALYTMEDGRPTYIDPKTGLLHVPIFFTEENIFSATVDNSKSKLTQDGVLWKAGVGIQSLNSSKVNKLGATGTQIAFHDAAGTKNEYMRIYVYDSDGKGVRNAGFLDLAVGLTKTVAEKGKCQLKVSGSVEPIVFTDPSQSRVIGQVGIEGVRLAKKSQIILKTSANTTVHKDGIEFTPMVALTYERKKWGVQNTVSFPTGKLVNNTNYNWTNHPMNSLAIYAFIGTKKKASAVPLLDP